ncbi:MAG: glycerol-3-phosphate acyltransferase [Anaerolineae bacterium]|nr:glycerol-3-phosphate acyltransferase [Anaerolineae bacterium]
MISPEMIFRMLLVVLASYLIGSIPTGYLFARSRGVDIFKVGSGNMGATNVARIGGIGWGIVVWLIDSSKGIVSILLATAVILPEDKVLATMLAAIFSIIGHNWSIFIGLLTGKIRGGKGAATAFGTLVIIMPVYVIAGMLILGGFIIARTRIVSLAVLAMFSTAALAMIVLLGLQLAPWPYTVGSLIIVAIVFYRFRDNIKRLQTGTERRLGDPA